MLLKVKSSCSLLEREQLRVKVGGKESLPYFRGQQPGETVDSCPKTDSPQIVSGQELLKGGFKGVLAEGGGYMQNSTVGSDSHFEIGHVVV